MIFLFTQIDHPEAFRQRGTPDADHIIASQYFLIEEILLRHGAQWFHRTPHGVLSVFEQGGSQDQAKPAEAALALQKDFQSHLWKDFGKAKLKIALHAGEAEPAGQDYVGPEVNHTLKVLEAARSGQILLTVPAVHFIPLTPGSRLKDMGEHFLKDLTPPQNLYVLVHPDLAEEDPAPPLSLGNFPQNFSPQPSPFFGREEEKAEIAELLASPSTYLVTLTGPGGFGKTRLAFQAAAEAIEKFKDGVFTVALAPLLSDHLLIASLANAVNFFFYGPEDPKAQLLGHLKEKQILLVMDNFEHIIEGAELVREMLAAAPGLKVLATSRESLGIKGENVFEVKGLRYPASLESGGLEASSAVQLFLKSARRVQPHFNLVHEDRGPLLGICRNLEGMPLGLELSATWVGTLSLPQIAEKIETSRDFLATSMPHLPARHRSVRAVFEYSWILLTEAQKKALKSITVFRGGFTAEAVKKVAGAGEELLERLAQKSILRKKGERWEIHELLKYYAKEKLFDDAEEKEKSFDAHSRYFGQWLGRKEKDLTGPRQQKALEELEEEIGNIREGWRRALQKAMVEELEGYLESYFEVLETKGWFQEGREAFHEAAQSIREAFPASGRPRAASLLLARLLCRWAEFERDLGNTPKAAELFRESLEDFKAASAPFQAGYAQGGLAKVLETQGDYQGAKMLFAKALRTFQRSKDRHGSAWSFNELGHMESLAGQFKAAQAFIRRSLSYSQAAGDQRSIGHSYVLLGDAFYGLGRLEDGKAFYQKGLDSYLQSGDRRGMSWAFLSLGRSAEMMGDYDGARQMYREGMVIAKDMGDLRGLAWVNNLMGFTHWATGGYTEARRLYEEGMALYRQIGDLRGQAWTLDLMGGVELAQGRGKEAGKLYSQSREIVLHEGMSTQNKAWDAFHQGDLAAFQGNHREALKRFKESLALFRSVEDGLGAMSTLLHLGEVSLSLKDNKAAGAYFRKAASFILDRHLKPFFSDLLVGIAQLTKAQGDSGQALSLLLLALSQPTCRQPTKDRMAALLTELKSHFSPQEIEGAVRWAKTARIEAIAAAWLSAHGEKPARRPKAKKKRGKAKRRK